MNKYENVMVNMMKKMHFWLPIIDEGDIELKKIHTKENSVNMLTKVVLVVKFAHCKELLHILLVTWVQWSSFRWTKDGFIPRAGGM